MRHRSAGPSPSVRLAEPVPRSRHRAPEVARAPYGRWRLGLAVVALVTGFVLAAPVVSGSDTSSRTPLDSSSAAGDSPVVMGLDGRPTSATFARASALLAVDADGAVRVEDSAGRADREPLRVAPAAPAPPPAPAPAPAVVPARAAPPVTARTPERSVPSAPPAAPAARTALPAKPAPPAPAVPAGLDRAGQVLALVNQERAAAGCRPLAADRGLTAVAAAHSADMRDRSFFDHVNLSGESPFDRADAAGVSARAENIARGQADAAAVMDSWMASPGHRANILDCGLTRLGVGIADGGGGPWWTQLFG